jgi:two-component system OmpR family response regulator
MNSTDRIKIVIVEDNKPFAHLLETELSKLLENENHTIHVFENGELCEQFLHINPDLVFVNYHLNSNNDSVMKGLDVIKMIKQNHKETDFVMITNDEQNELFLKILQIGAFDYLIKNTGVICRLGLTVQKWLSIIKIKQDIKTTIN